MSTIITNKNSTNSSAPAATGLTAGELAICTLSGSEKLYTKNSAGTVVNLLDWSKVGSKPTTLSGYGITDAVSTTSLNNHINNSSVHLSTNQLNVLNRLSIVDNKLQISGDTYSTGDISAFGVASGSTSSGGGLITTVNTTSNLGGTFLDTDYTSTFNSAAINSIYLATNTNTSNVSTLNNTVSSLNSTVSTLNSNVSTLSTKVASLTGGTTSITGTYYNSSSGKYVYEGGYTILASGLIWQWGRLSGDDGTYSFPYTFPHKCLSIQITTNRTSSGSNGTNHAGNLTTSTFYAVLDATEGWFFAIGY